MAGDGVSLPTNIAQLGHAAKAQARGQQQPQQVTPFSEQQDKREELRVQRVKETDATDHRRIEDDDDPQDKRQRRRHKRRRKQVARSGEKNSGKATEEPDNETEAEIIGGLVDLRA